MDINGDKWIIMDINGYKQIHLTCNSHGMQKGNCLTYFIDICEKQSGLELSRSGPTGT